jgi:hypothetical protein
VVRPVIDISNDIADEFRLPFVLFTRTKVRGAEPAVGMKVPQKFASLGTLLVLVQFD